MQLTMALAASMIVMAGVGYWYYTDSQSRMETLRENVATLSVANERNQATIDQMEFQAAENTVRIQTLQTDLQKAEEYNTTLRNMFQRHDLTRLAEEKPGLIENRINDGTNEVFDSIMRDTGAE